MLRAVFIFGLCLTLVGVGMGNYFAWIPETVPTVAEQCIAFGYAGVCSNGVSLATPAVCGGVMCALRLPADIVYVPRMMAIANGTICGRLNVCKNGACKRIPVTRFPRQYGTRVNFHCESDSGDESDNYYDEPSEDEENVVPYRGRA